MEKVAVQNCGNYSHDSVDQALQKVLEAIQFKMPSNSTVLIKPNIMSQNRPEQATITHFSIVEGLCILLKDSRCKIQIGDSISFYQTGLTKKAFKTARLDKVAKKYDAELVAFEEEPLIKNTEKSTFLKEIYIPKKVLEADMIIDACKLKSHSLMRLSGAVKNMFGIMPGGYKQRLHGWTESVFDLANVFIDLFTISNPSLCLMDAVTGLDGGPSAAGKPVKVGKILASINPFALDAVACKMIGYQPSDIAILVRGVKRNLIANYDDIEILEDGKTISIGSYHFPIVRFKNIQTGRIPPIKNNKSVLATQTYVFPKVLKPKVSNPEACIEVCPTGAIFINEKKLLSIDLDKCINCYHCTYACGDKTIGFKSSMMNKLIRAARFIIGI